MNNRKSTKRALLTSLLSLLLCCSMLIGTTFAWFTDEVKSGNNIIQAGNLDVELKYAKVVNGQLTAWDTVDGKDNIFDPSALWEPGRVEVVYLKVSNLGTLALKYQLGVNVASETPGTNVEGKEFKLSDYLVFKVVEMPDALSTYTDREAVQLAAGTEKGLKDYNGTTTNLEVNGVDYVALIVYMPETVGNEANYRGTDIPQITLGINLFATQQMAEEDSFGPDYDKDAWHEKFQVYTAADLTTALANGEDVVLMNDVTTDEVVEITEDVKIDLNGHTLTATGENAYLFNVTGDADLTIVGGELVAQSTNGVVDGTGTSTGASGVVYFASTGTLTMTDVQVQGSVYGGKRAVQVFKGDATLTNVDITTAYGSGVNAGSGASVVLNDCDITVNGMYIAPYNSVCFSVMGGASLTVNSGNYKQINNATYSTGDTHGGWIGIVMNSGGTMTINGGTYTNVPTTGFNASYERAILHAQAGANAPATLVLHGGTFDPQATEIYELSDGATVEMDGYKAVESNGKYVIVSDTIADENVVATPDELEAALSGAADAGSGDNTIYLTGDIDLTGTTWESISVDGYNGAGIITIEGNGATIKGLTAPLFAGGFAGKSGIVIKNLTIADSNIVGGTQGGGAFVDCADSMQVITLENCHLINSTVTGERAGGLIGWVSGYANENDGPVKTYVTITNCSVVDSTVIGAGSAGAIAGHPGASDYTYTTIENCVVKNVDVVSNDDGSWRTGAIVGTANNGHVVINNVTVEDVTLTQNGVAAETIVLYGRFVPSGTGTLVIDGAAVLPAATTEALMAAITSGDTEVYLPSGNYTMPEPDLKGKTLTITGTKDTVIDVSAVNANDQFVTGATIVFDGVTLNFGKTNYMGFANTASLTYKDCTINGLQFLYGANVTFENCVLNSDGAEHCVWTYGAQNVSFIGCEFTYGDRGINCYSDNDVTGGKQTVNFTNCTFVTENTASEGAVEINSCYFSVGIEVNMTGCTAPEHGELAYVSSWDSTNGAKTTINIK